MADKKNLLVWLEWNIDPFRLDERNYAILEGEVPGGTRIVRARDEQSFLAALPEADIVLTWNFRAEWYALAPRLKTLATPAAGREFIAPPPPGVRLHHGHFHGPIIAETVLALMLAWCRGIVRALRPEARPEAFGEYAGRSEARMESTDAGNCDSALWRRRELAGCCRTLAGTEAVILGYGNIGKAIGRLLDANGVKVAGFGRRNFSGFEAALQRADWLVLALPGDTGTDRIIDARRLALMKPSAAIVNVGRGNAIDEPALAAALREGRLAAALLDVFASEPIRPGDPLAGDDIPHLVRLPHASAFSPDYLGAFFRELASEGMLA